MNRCRPLSLMQNWNRRLLPIAVCLLVLLITHHLSLITARAQSASATLNGTVLDPNGAVVPAASITVTEVATGVQRTATTNDQGYFSIPLLKPSTYLLQVEHPGFMTAEVKDVVLNVGDQRSLRIQMKVDTASTLISTSGTHFRLP